MVVKIGLSACLNFERAARKRSHFHNYNWLSMDFLGDSQGATGCVVNDDLSALNKAWVTEANAPEILPYRADIVDLLQEKLTSQQVRNGHS